MADIKKTFKSGKYVYRYDPTMGQYYRILAKYYSKNKLNSGLDNRWKNIQKRAYLTAYNKKYNPKTSLLSDKWKKQLYKSSDWKNKPWINKNGGRLLDVYKPLMLSSKGVSYSRIKINGKRRNDYWGAKIGQGKGSTGVYVFKSFFELQQHLMLAQHLLAVQAENFRVVVGRRALRIFELSFKYHKFYNEGKSWKNLASYTQKKRKWKKTWHGVHASKLNEYGKLAESLKIESTPQRTRIYTEKIRIKRPDSKKGWRTVNMAYAGIHNEGVPRGNKWGKAIPQRQFMGWDSAGSLDKVDKFAYSIADRYLFDSVFLVKKSK